MKVALRILCAPAALVLLGGCWSHVSPEASQRFQARQGRFTLTVYPVHVVRGGRTTADFRLGRELVEWINAQDLAEARPAARGLPIAVVWRANQAKMAQQSAKAFGAWVQRESPETDYALQAEILCNRDETQVLGVHVYLAEKSGQLAAGGLTNSHWEAFQRIRPVDRQGGLAVLKEMILNLRRHRP